MLFATRYLASLGFPDNVVDNFWTITGYFNSLRELGGASTQILDDVQSRLFYLARTKFAEKYPGVDTSKDYTYTEELTSRMSNSEITDVIQVKLKRSYTAENHDDVFDYLLASNMISVGVDVGRLGAMVVAGQPKTNAEYIQATSRVGRDNPGLVITVYNASRSRDRSHYEQFLKYHSALYRYVEATSLLSRFTDHYSDLIIGVNLGGLGTLIASMASLISFKILAHNYNEKKGRYLGLFTVMNIVYLAILLGLYYLIRRF